MTAAADIRPAGRQVRGTPLEKDDVSTLAASLLGGVGAVAMFLSALAVALGCGACRYTMYAGVAMLLASVAFWAALLVPRGERGAGEA